MRTLALDTSGPIGSIAIVSGDRLEAETVIVADRRHNEQLVPAIQSLLAQLGLTPADLEAFAVGLGPGSFTGLRTSLSLVKGLVLGNPRPVIGVDSLEALAAAVSSPGLIAPITDARKGEVFVALFRSDGHGNITRESPDLALAPDRLADLIREPALLLGDGLNRYRDLITQTLAGRGELAPESLWSVRAAVLARLAAPRLARHDSDPIDSLVPIYVRASDAELKLGPRTAR